MRHSFSETTEAAGRTLTRKPRLLMVATMARHFHLFERVNVEVLRNLNVEVHGAANFRDSNARLDNMSIHGHHIAIQRNPASPKNLVAFFQLVRLIRKYKIDAIHCHSPVGGVLGRIAGVITGVHPIIYTVHGFHFFKGGPTLNQMVYRPIEKALARATDIMITINDEDFEAAKSLHPKATARIPGVGVRLERFRHPDSKIRQLVRRQLGIPEDALVLLSAGELNENKNHALIIEALAAIELGNVHWLLCGNGPLQESLKDLMEERGLQANAALLGFRDDVPDLMAAADVFLHPSRREGLPVAVIEAMATGLPCIVSEVRGNVDLIVDGFGGIVLNSDSEVDWARAIQKMRDPVVRRRMGEYNVEKSREYGDSSVYARMRDIYSSQGLGGPVETHPPRAALQQRFRQNKS